MHVDPATTEAGAYAVLTVRVPNESATAATTQVSVDLPTDQPLTYVGVEPVPGWTATVEEGDLPEPVEVDGATLTRAPVRVVWTADGAGIGDGEFQRFTISAGPLPAAGTDVVLPAHQTYSDGEVVDWDQLAEGDAEPEHPAPVFTTTAASDGPDGSAAPDGSDAPGASDAATQEAAPAAPTEDDGSAVPAVLGGLGLGAGLVALVVAVLAWRRSGTAAR
ncbi:YcnI family copper-binding membrane protein [Cellulomonas sp. Marseille-Q8402]